MKKCKKSYKITKRLSAILLVLMMALTAPMGKLQVQAAQLQWDKGAITESGTEPAAQDNTETTENSNINGTLGKNTDVGIEITKSITGKAGKNVKISFVLKSADSSHIKLKTVYPVIDSAFPFETSGDAYKVVSAGSDTDKQAKLSASFKMKARSDIQSGYQSVRFIAEYSKLDESGVMEDYYVIKTINIYFEEPASSSDKEDDESDSDYSGEDSDSGSYDVPDEDEEVSAPKLLITGYDTDPQTIMAGETFKLTIHIQNTSKSTPVCNGKFLIGNEAGTFLPTSGSSAVFIEKIPAGETGDLEIELKTAADLAQKNYILVVKGDFDDGKGNNFTSSDNLSIPVNQEIRLGISDVSMSPEVLAIDGEGSLMFTINNQSNAGVYNVSVSPKDDAVTGEEAYVGNIAASSSAYATLYLTGVKDNAETGSIKIAITYEDAAGNTETIEETVACSVSEDAEIMDDEWEDEEYDELMEEESGIPLWLIILLVVLIIIVIVIIIVIAVRRKKKRMAQLLEEDDLEEELLGEGDSEEELLGEDGKKDEDF